MKTIVGVAVMAILISIVVVGTIAATDNIDARTSGSESVVAAGSSSGFNTAVCGPDAVHACQTSAGK
jgi:hypothetical protein